MKHRPTFQLQFLLHPVIQTLYKQFSGRVLPEMGEGFSSFLKRKLLQPLKGLGWRRGLMLLAFILVVGFTGLNVFRVARHLTHGQYERDEEIRGWMTIGYIGHSYHVPPQIIQEALGLPESPPDTRPLSEIARAQDRSVDELTASLQDAIMKARPAPPDKSLPPEERNKQ
jgi:hypothetical protein